MSPKPQESPAIGPEAFDPKLLSEKYVTEQGGKVMDGAGVLVRIPTLEGRLFKVPLEYITPNPNQPRKYFDEDKLDNLRGSIDEKGQLDPLKCVPFKNKKGDIWFLIVDGERRFRVMRELGKPTCEMRVEWIDSEDDIFLKSLILTVNRDDYNLIEKALAYDQIIRRRLEKGKTSKAAIIESLTEVVGVSENTIYNNLLLLQLPEKIQTLVANGPLSQNVALFIVKSKKDAGDKLDLDMLAELLVAEAEKLSDETVEKIISMHTAREAIKKCLKMSGEKNTADRLRTKEDLAPVFDIESHARGLRKAFKEAGNTDPEVIAKFLEERPVPPEELRDNLNDLQLAIALFVRKVVSRAILPPLPKIEGKPSFTGQISKLTKCEDKTTLAVLNKLAEGTDQNGRVITFNKLWKELGISYKMLEAQLKEIPKMIAPLGLKIACHTIHEKREGHNQKYENQPAYRLEWITDTEKEASKTPKPSKADRKAKRRHH